MRRRLWMAGWLVAVGVVLWLLPFQHGSAPVGTAPALAQPVQPEEPVPPAYYCDREQVATCRYGEWLEVRTPEEILQYCAFPSWAVPRVSIVTMPLGTFCAFAGPGRLSSTTRPVEEPVVVRATSLTGTTPRQRVRVPFLPPGGTP